MTRPPHTVVIVGAGLAGARCAETLRYEGFEGRIVLVGDEHVPPYRRPALSKELLAGAMTPEQLELKPAGAWAEHGVTLLLGQRVVRIDVGQRRAVLADSTTLRWDALVFATGARARTLAAPAPAGVHLLRTLSDALALRAELTPARRLAVIGTGLVGLEAASTAAALGVAVTLVGRRPPLHGIAGAEIAALLAQRIRATGVRLRLGAAAAGFRTDSSGRVAAIQLDDGTAIVCDAALVAVGAEPNDTLLAQRSVVPAGGLAVDATGRSPLPGVYAAGDVAAPWNSRSGKRAPHGHWTSAAGQGAAAARTILGLHALHADPPYFWSDQFGIRLQHVGDPTGWTTVELNGERDSFLARYRSPDGRLVAALAANRPQDIGRLRRELASASAPLAA